MPAFVFKLPVFTLAAFMAFMGLQKFIGDVPIFAIIEANVMARTGMDLAFIDPAGRYLTGVLELAAAALLVFRPRPGILLSMGVLAGAILAHLTFLGISTPMSADPGAEESPALFIMALAGMALAAFAYWANTRRAG